MDTSTAQGTVTVRVLLNGEPPTQERSCSATGSSRWRHSYKASSTSSMAKLVVVDDEIIELIQRTTAANAFNFVAHPLGPGTTYSIEVQARVDSATSSQQGSASTVGSVGKASVTVDAHRLVKGDEVIVVD